jgi:hypothetical protein
MVNFTRFLFPCSLWSAQPPPPPPQIVLSKHKPIYTWNSSTLPTSTLKMKTTCTSKCQQKWLTTSTRCNNQRAELASTVGHCKNLKSEIIVLIKWWTVFKQHILKRQTDLQTVWHERVYFWKDRQHTLQMIITVYVTVKSLSRRVQRIRHKL